MLWTHPEPTPRTLMLHSSRQFPHVMDPVAICLNKACRRALAEPVTATKPLHRIAESPKIDAAKCSPGGRNSKADDLVVMQTTGQTPSAFGCRLSPHRKLLRSSLLRVCRRARASHAAHGGSSMKCLFGQNLSTKLVNLRTDLVPGASHVQSVRLDCASRDQI
jgi:hypothetical protein